MGKENGQTSTLWSLQKLKTLSVPILHRWRKWSTLCTMDLYDFKSFV